MDTNVLEQIGLSQKEVAVYLALLQKGAATVSSIAERTGIDRTLCYSLLNKLVDRGYVNFVIEDNKKQFSATDPSKFLSDVQALEEQLKVLLPDLHRLATKREQHLSVEIYKGREGIRGIFSDFLNLKSDAYLFGDIVRFQKIAPIHLEKYFRYLEEKNLNEYLIFPEGDDPGLHPVRSKYRTVPRKLVSASAIWVYADRTAITVWSEPPVVILIKNQEAADNYRAYFDYLWKIGSKKGILTKKPRL